MDRIRVAIVKGLSHRARMRSPFDFGLSKGLQVCILVHALAGARERGREGDSDCLSIFNLINLLGRHCRYTMLTIIEGLRL